MWRVLIVLPILYACGSPRSRSCMPILHLVFPWAHIVLVYHLRSGMVLKLLSLIVNKLPRILGIRHPKLLIISRRISKREFLNYLVLKRAIFGLLHRLDLAVTQPWLTSVSSLEEFTFAEKRSHRRHLNRTRRSMKIGLRICIICLIIFF